MRIKEELRVAGVSDEELIKLLQNTAKRKMLHDALTTSLAHLAADFRCKTQEFEAGRGKSLRIFGRHEPARVPQHPGRITDVRGHHWHCTGHGLTHDIGKTLTEG